MSIMPTREQQAWTDMMERRFPGIGADPNEGWRGGLFGAGNASRAQAPVAGGGELGPDINGPLAANAAKEPPRSFMSRLGDALMYYSAAQGSPLGLAGVQMKQQDAQTRLRQRMEEVQAERQERMIRDRYAWQRQYDINNPEPRIMQAGDQIISVQSNGQGAPQVIYDAPDKAPQPGEQERLLELWSKLPDTDPRKSMIGYMLRGANLRPDIYQPKVDYETAGRLRVKTTAPGKAASTGSGKGGGKGGKAKPNSDLDYLRGN